MKNIQSLNAGLIILFISTLSCLSCTPNNEDPILTGPILTSPIEGATFTTTDSVRIAADVSEISSARIIEFWVECVDSSYIVFTADKAPFDYTTQLNEGVFEVWATCIYNTGEEIESDKISITVTEPIPESFIHISSPTNEAVFSEYEDIEVNIDVQEPDGIKLLSLYVDNELHSFDSIDPYTFTVSNLSPGLHTLAASCEDSLGNTSNSEEMNITIEEVTIITTTPYDGGIILPERERTKLFINKGGISAGERDWNNPDNLLWEMPLKNAKGVEADEIAAYNSLWNYGGTSINDVKRVIHKGSIHLVVTGNGGDAVAMYEYATKKCIFWSGTTASGPHDVEYAPVGNGYILVANPAGNGAVLEVYDISSNNKGRAFSVAHKGIHSVHWDAKQNLAWAWGSGQNGLKSYKLEIQNGQPVLTGKKEYVVSVADYEVGMAHGGSPMLIDGRRYLILAGKEGILQFDTESHEWDIVRWADRDEEGEATGLFRGCKGLSYNDNTGEIIIGKARDKIYSEDDNIGTRQLDNSEMYKARWWLHNSFSHE